MGRGQLDGQKNTCKGDSARRTGSNARNLAAASCPRSARTAGTARKQKHLQTLGRHRDRELDLFRIRHVPVLAEFCGEHDRSSEAQLRARTPRHERTVSDILDQHVTLDGREALGLAQYSSVERQGRHVLSVNTLSTHYFDRAGRKRVRQQQRLR
jgi:hypothetical protein